MMELATKSRKTEVVRKAILEQISSSRIAPGSRLPGENELTRQFGVSRNTVREAVSTLVQQGVLYRRQGSGTYVGEAVPKDIPTGPAVNVFRVGLVSFQSVTASPIPYILRVMKGLADPLEEMPKIEITLLCSEPQFQGAGGLHFLEAARQKRVDGFLFSVIEGIQPQYLAELSERGFPVVFLSYEAPFPGYMCVGPDLSRGVQKTVERLYRSGRRRIGLLLARRTGRAAAAFLAGYIAARSRMGLDCQPPPVEYTDGSAELLVGAVERLLSQNLDAVLGYDDEVAVELVRQACRLGIRVPEDLAVVGTNDTVDPQAGDCPPLTTLRLPLEEMGRTCRDQFLLIRSGGGQGSRAIMFEPELIVRKTALAE